MQTLSELRLTSPCGDKRKKTFLQCVEFKWCNERIKIQTTSTSLHPMNNTVCVCRNGSPTTKTIAANIN